jgi:peptidoglycan/LPS O-acetylase OafA/YrhL
VATALFVHGFHPQSINSVAPGGWSIAIEMTFYAVFPLLARFITSWQTAVAGLFLSFALSEVTRPLAAHWWPAEDRVLVANSSFGFPTSCAFL